MAADQLLSVKQRDAAGRVRTDIIFFNPAETLANIQLFATAFIPAYDDAVVGMIESATVTINLALPGPLKGAPVLDGDVRVSGLLTYASTSRFKHGQYVHGLLPSLFVADEVDTGDLLVSTLDAAFRAGLGGVAPTDGHGFDLVTLASTKKSLLK